MGYSHYFILPQKPTVKAWRAFTTEVKAILGHPAIAPLVCLEQNKPMKPPKITREEVRFNGKEENGHETFMISRSTTNDFCKTGGICQADILDQWGKSYDVAVCAVLISAHHHLQLEVSSDGEWDEDGWMRARTIYGVVTNRLPLCPWAQKSCAQCHQYFALNHSWGGGGKSSLDNCYMCSNGYETKAQAREDLAAKMHDLLAELADKMSKMDSSPS